MRILDPDFVMTAIDQSPYLDDDADLDPADRQYGWMTLAQRLG